MCWNARLSCCVNVAIMGDRTWIKLKKQECMQTTGVCVCALIWWNEADCDKIDIQTFFQLLINLPLKFPPQHLTPTCLTGKQALVRLIIVVPMGSKTLWLNTHWFNYNSRTIVRACDWLSKLYLFFSLSL